MKNKPTPPELLLNTRTALLFFELSYEKKKQCAACRNMKRDVNKEQHRANAHITCWVCIFLLYPEDVSGSPPTQPGVK